MAIKKRKAEIVKADETGAPVENNESATVTDIKVVEPGKPGRPLIFESPEELAVKIDAYFKYCEEGTSQDIVTKSGEVVTVKQKMPYTLSGLADYLDIDRKTLLNYSYRDDFSPLLMRARRKCEKYSEEQLYIGNDRGAKFGLINNYGWADKQETVVSGPNGAPLQVQAVPFTYQDFANLTDADQQKLLEAAKIMESLKNK